MSGSTPRWLVDEPHSPKRDIEVQGLSRSQILHPASRVSFEKIQSIEYNVPILKMGTVTEESLRFLTAYSKQEADHSES